MRSKFFLILFSAAIALPAFAVRPPAASGSPDALIAAIQADDPSQVRKLLAAGANLESRSEKGVTPLMVAAYLGKTDVLPVLIAAKADLEARDLKNRTALMWAADGGRYDAVRLLLDAGARVDAIGERNATPLMFAAQGGFDDVVALLVERGADVSRRADADWTALEFAKQNHHDTTVDLLENGGHQKATGLKFNTFRGLLYPESPLESVWLREKWTDKEIEAVRQLALKGELQKARDLLESGSEASRGKPGYWWKLLYLQRKLGDRKGALASIHKILVTPDLGSRETLRIWTLARELGEAPPPDLSKRALGVVVESGLGSMVLVVAAYADGQPRFFTSAGAGVFGETWTDAETRKDLEIVHLAQRLVDGMTPSESRELPKPGRIRFIVLTPSGSYEAEDSYLWCRQGRYAQLFATTDQLFGMLFKTYQEQPGKDKSQ